MTNYRRIRARGGTYFFTVALADRGASTLTDRIDLLRGAYSRIMGERPFRCDAFVVLPDHLHAVWSLPEGDADYSTRWGAFKALFTRSLKSQAEISPIRRSASKVAKGDAGVWQRRYWEHTIRDPEDFRMHVRYCWSNPVRHGLVSRPVDWPFSSIHRDIRAGIVEPEWGGDITEGEFGEP